MLMVSLLPTIRSCTLKCSHCGRFLLYLIGTSALLMGCNTNENLVWNSTDAALSADSRAPLPLAKMYSPSRAIDPRSEVAYSTLIVGGSPALHNQVPWQVLVRNSLALGDDADSCGGTLVHPQWIISAAHCFARPTVFFSQRDVLDPPSLEVIAGIRDIQLLGQGERRSVRRLIVHPDFDRQTFEHDLALLYVDPPIFCLHCQPIGLVTPSGMQHSDREDWTAPPGTWGTISGWGNQQPQSIFGTGLEEYPRILQVLEVPVYDNATCVNDSFLDVTALTENMLCAGFLDGRGDGCSGDSGGPLTVRKTDGTGHVLAGVISWGIGCAVPGYLGVYTRISRYHGWIYEQTQGAVGVLPGEIPTLQVYHWKSETYVRGVGVWTGTASGIPALGTTDAYGRLSEWTRDLRLYLETGPREQSAIRAADALAALRIAVGLTPQAGGEPASPFQYWAADVNGDGRVTAADALEVLKQAVLSLEALDKRWVFVPEVLVTDSTPPTRQRVPNPGMIQPGQAVVAVLVGDVLGTWVPPDDALARGSVPPDRVAPQPVPTR
jgi:secreted trypsin-like serine protease